MKIVKDCIGRTVCKVDPNTGLVASEYKRHRTSTILNVGETFTIERENVVTKITRTKTSFKVESHRVAA